MTVRFMPQHPRFGRRTAIQAGSIGLLGLGSNHLQALEQAQGDRGPNAFKAKRVVFVFLSGGLGQQDSFDLRLDNLVSLRDGRLSVFGTNQNDFFRFNIENEILIIINSVDYKFDSSQVSSIYFDGQNGIDAVDLQLGSSNDTVVLTGNRAFVDNMDFRLAAIGFDTINVWAGQGADQVAFLDSAGADVFELNNDESQMTGAGYQNTAAGFDTVVAYSKSGHDSALMIGSQSSDRISVSAEYAFLSNSNVTATAKGFDEIEIDGMAGSDSSFIRGSDGNDQISMTGKSSRSSIAGTQISIYGVESSYEVWR